MEKLFISGENLARFLDCLARDLKLVAPARDEEGIISFRPVDGAGQVLMDYQNSTVPPKTFFFPQTEKMFSFSYFKEGVKLDCVSGPDKRVLFGVRPCDLRSILSLDPVFGGTFRDAYYMEKRENSTIIGMACSKPSPRCFCTTFGFGPADGEGADIMLTAAVSGYIVELRTDRGSDLADSQRGLFERKPAIEEAQAAPPVKKLDLTGVKEVLDDNFDLEYWDRIFEKCLGCGICTYLCPTCHCFDIFDFAAGGPGGERRRGWDSCMFGHFTLMAGGHNPRPSKKERVRNRFMHKLKYHIDRYGLAGCSGCGRCVKACPVNIDIRRIITDLGEVYKNGQPERV
ncbi:MAG: 4Fe-4S dicluster domain-containing protein [Bacillota bacterium]